MIIVMCFLLCTAFDVRYWSLYSRVFFNNRNLFVFRHSRSKASSSDKISANDRGNRNNILQYHESVFYCSMLNCWIVVSGVFLACTCYQICCLVWAFQTMSQRQNIRTRPVVKVRHLSAAPPPLIFLERRSATCMFAEVSSVREGRGARVLNKTLAGISWHISISCSVMCPVCFYNMSAVSKCTSELEIY